MKRAVYRENLGRRAQPLFALLGLRSPLAQHTPSEGELLQRYATGARCVVEIGVAEGVSALELREVIASDGTLYLIDPYPLGRLLGRSAAELVARRTVSGCRRGNAVWQRQFSYDAARGWQKPIDFLFIDGDHRYEAVRRDWDEWSPHVRPGGIIALHDARLEAPWLGPNDGPVRLASEIATDRDWETLDGVDSLLVLRRAHPPCSGG
jgi:predicted O-methyltransferase YrrM